MKAPDMAVVTQTQLVEIPEYDAAVADLVRGKDAWARSAIADRI